MVVLPGGLFATTNDSGDTGRVFVVDRTGRTVGVTHWSDSPRDVEALALAPSDSGGSGAGADVWVGDTGDNSATREHIQVTKVPVGRGDRTVAPASYDLVYPDGAHDAETLLCDPATGRLYVATKGWLGGTLYAAPKRLVAGAENRLSPVGAVLPMATDGAFLPGGDAVLIRGYFSATTYRWPSMDKIASFPLPRQDQGEGVGMDPDDPTETVWLSSEGVHSDVISMPLPQRARPHAEADDTEPASEQSQADTHADTDETDDIDGTGETPSSHWPWFLGGAAVVVAVAGALGGVLRSRRF